MGSSAQAALIVLALARLAVFLVQLELVSSALALTVAEAAGLMSKGSSAQVALIVLAPSPHY